MKEETDIYFALEPDPHGTFGTGKILYIVPYAKRNGFTHTTTISIGIYKLTEKDEAGNIINSAKRADLTDLASASVRHVDANGDEKYAIVDNAGTWELQEIESWKEKHLDYGIPIQP